jgi:hypothetical protein
MLDSDCGMSSPFSVFSFHTCPAPTEPRIPARGESPGTGYNPGTPHYDTMRTRSTSAGMRRSVRTRESSASPTQSITYPAYPERCSGLVCDVPLGHTCPAPTEPRIPARGTTPGSGYNPRIRVEPRPCVLKERVNHPHHLPRASPTQPTQSGALGWYAMSRWDTRVRLQRSRAYQPGVQPRERGTTPGTGYNPGNGVQPRERGATPGSGLNLAHAYRTRKFAESVRKVGFWALGTVDCRACSRSPVCRVCVGHLRIGTVGGACRLLLEH